MYNKFVKAVKNPLLVKSYIQKVVVGKYVSKYRKKTSVSWEDYYRRTTKNASDFRGLVGPAEDFDEMAEWQTQFLKNKGLNPENTILDIGCGVLRGGIPLIDYLEKGNYYGMDISIKALQKGHERVHEKDLGWKQPTVIQNEDLSLEEVEKETFDFVWLQSVVTHLPPEKTRFFFSSVGKVMSEESVVYATFHETDSYEPIDIGRGVRESVDFEYSIEWLKDKAENHGLQLEKVEASHPHNHSIFKLTGGDSK